MFGQTTHGSIDIKSVDKPPTLDIPRTAVDFQGCLLFEKGDRQVGLERSPTFWSLFKNDHPDQWTRTAYAIGCSNNRGSNPAMEDH
jgi:hypothetical protein